VFYSRWRPDTGGYDYFATAERRGLGDDMPVPQLVPVSNLGVASTDAGRAPDGPITKVGSGPFAKGAIMRLSRQGLSGSGVGFSFSFSGLAMLVVGALAGFWIGKRWKP